MKNLIAIATALLSLQVNAADFSANIESGYARAHGSMANDSQPFSSVLTHTTTDSDFLQIGMLIDITSFNSFFKNSNFEFSVKEPVSILSFSFAGTGCHPTDKVDLCLGLGQGTVNVNSQKRRRDFGSWNYHFFSFFHINDYASAFLHTRYVGQVEIEDNGKKAEFGYKTVGLGISYKVM